MAFSISEFRSELKLDGARPNLFRVTIPFPSLVDGGTTASSSLVFMAKSSQLPGSSIGSIPIHYFGREVKVAGNRSFPDWTITIINDEDFGIRNAFERWHGTINSHNANLRNANAVNMLGYQVDAIVEQFGKAGNVIKTYKMVGAFPIDLAPIDLDWGSQDSVEEFTVTFAFQLWESDTTDVA